MAVGNATLGEVVRRHLEGDAIARQNSNSIASQLAGQVSENCSILVQLHAEQSAREFFYNGTSNFYAVFFTHSPLTNWDCGDLRVSRRTQPV